MKGTHRGSDGTARNLNVAVAQDFSSRVEVRRLGVAAAVAALALTTSLIGAPGRVQAQPCASPEPDCSTFSCVGTCGIGPGACAQTTEGENVCVIPACVAPCNTSADCPSNSVCFTLGCCGPATFCVPLCSSLETNGAPCTAPGECQSGNCVDGVCCDTACDQPMEQCNLAGSAGTCTAVAAAAPALSAGGMLASLAALIGIAAMAFAGRGAMRRRVKREA